MRRTAALLPVLLLTVGCASKLGRDEAGRLLAAKYPRPLTVAVPRSDVAEKDSPAWRRLVALKDAADRGGAFETSRSPEGTKERFTFTPKGEAFPDGPGGMQVPAAEAAFVKPLDMRGDTARAEVLYQVRLDRPTALFPLFLVDHPGAKAGEVRDRVARFERHGRKWDLVTYDMPKK